MTPERTLGALEYLAGVAELAIVVGALGYAAVRLRRALLPAWSGSPALVADLTAGLTLAVVVAQLLGTFSLFNAWAFPLACVVVAVVAHVFAGVGGSPSPSRSATPEAPPSRTAFWVVAIVCAAVFAGWAIPTLTGIAGGMGRADSLWYHMPLSARFIETGSLGDLYFFDPIFFASFYPANSEIFHAIPLLAFERDFLSPLLNVGFLALGLLAAWAIGRPYGVAPQALVGAAVVLGAETMTDFQAGEALNDMTGVAFLLCAMALLVNRNAARAPAAPTTANVEKRDTMSRNSTFGGAGLAALGFAGAAGGLAAGTKLSFLAPVALLTVAVVAIAPRGLRVRSTVAWSVPMLLAGGYWYARNLVTVGNPIPFTSWGPLGLPSPERAFELRPGFSVSHYWNDVETWSDWFFPFLAEELGPLWPVVLLGALGGGAYALWRVRDPVLRALGAVVLLTAVAYLFTPLTAGGEEGEPISFEWNIRYLVPAVAIGLAMLPCLPVLRSTPERRLLTLAGLAALALFTTLTIVQWPEGGHTKGAVAAGILVLGAFAAAGWLVSRGHLGPAAPRRNLVAAGALIALAAVAAGFLVQRHYLERRYENLSPELNIAEAVRWAQDQRDERIAISGVRGVFNQFAFAGTDLSNHVQWLGVKGEDEAFLRIPDCETWREEVNSGDYGYVVTMYDPYSPQATSPPGVLTDTKEGLWTRTDPATTTVLRDGPVGVYEVTGELDPGACGALPDLAPAELTGASVNLEQLANQPPPGSRP